MKKLDAWLIMILLFIAVAVFAFNQLLPKQNAAFLAITVDGKPYQTVSLSKNRTIRIEKDGKVNVVEIKDGQVRMVEANCPDKLCMHQAPLGQNNVQPIICLPNRVVLDIVDSQPQGLDAISE